MDLRAVVKYLPSGSALSRETNPDWWITPEVVILREVEHASRVGAWLHTEDGRRGRNFPQRFPLTESERVGEGTQKPNAMSPREMNAWLGGPFAALNERR